MKKDIIFTKKEIKDTNFYQEKCHCCGSKNFYVPEETINGPFGRNMKLLICKCCGTIRVSEKDREALN